MLLWFFAHVNLVNKHLFLLPLSLLEITLIWQDETAYDTTILHCLPFRSWITFNLRKSLVPSVFEGGMTFWYLCICIAFILKAWLPVCTFSTSSDSCRSRSSRARRSSRTLRRRSFCQCCMSRICYGGWEPNHSTQPNRMHIHFDKSLSLFEDVFHFRMSHWPLHSNPNSTPLLPLQLGVFSPGHPSCLPAVGSWTTNSKGSR